MQLFVTIIHSFPYIASIPNILTIKLYKLNYFLYYPFRLLYYPFILKIRKLTWCVVSIICSSSVFEGKKDLRSKLGTDPDRVNAFDAPFVNSILLIDMASSFWRAFP